MRIQACTYNGHLALGSDPSSWLVPTLAEGSTPSTEPAEIVAVGFQELIPLHLSLVGLTRTALTLHEDVIQSCVESHFAPETYTLIAKKALGGTALLVFTRDGSTTKRVVDVRVAEAAVGVFGLMGNKGAVGVRVVLEAEKEWDEKGEARGESVVTMVTAHLAAHDRGLERRNRDWRSIVERLVFAEGVSEHYELQGGRRRDVVRRVKAATNGDADGIQIFDTSYLLFFGDLNYRISPITPERLNLNLLAGKLANDLPSLLAHDQLQQQQTLGKTLHHLHEGAIMFPPTYKFVVGTLNEYAKFTKRVPGWCDRILYATWADGDKANEATKVELYRSIPSLKQSDHKPVTAIFSFPDPPIGPAASLPFPAPFPIDPLWRQKALIGRLLDRTVGFFWCLIMLAGLNSSVRLGLINLVGAALAAWYYRFIL